MSFNLKRYNFGSSDDSEEIRFTLTYRIPNPHPHFTRLSARHAANLESCALNRSYNNLSPFKSFSSSCLPKDLSLVQSESRLNQSCSNLERFVSDFRSTMDYEQICGRSRRSSYAGWMKYLFYIVLGLIVLWYVNGRIEESRGNIDDFHTDLCDMKSQMSVIQNGYEKDTKQRLSVMQKDTQHKLEAIENLLNEIKKNQQAHPARPADGSSGGDSPASPMLNINRDDPVYHMVRQILQEYDADKTGKVDFALESAGGSIISSGNTEPYTPSGSSITLFGIPLCSSLHGPRAIIQASSLPGECWAFKGSQGSAVIRLLGPVIIHCVSVEHISRTISPSGELDSAPKDFSIWGLQNGDEGGLGRKLGEFSYDINGPPIQFFFIGSDEAYEYVELKVLSNHGNPVYTCVYRLRVHGQLDSMV